MPTRTAGSARSSVIEAEGISKSFGANPALDRVSFEVSAGEIVGLLGPNGSGKTTLMRILTGFFPADAGAAIVAGIRIADDPLEVREPGRLPPGAGAALSRADRRAAPRLRRRGEDAARRRRARERVDAVVADCGLGAVRQRSGIGHAVEGLPPARRHRAGARRAAAGAGPRRADGRARSRAGRSSCAPLVRSLKGRTTILLSSHILADVASVCDRVLILHRGRLVLAERLDHAPRSRCAAPAEIVLRTRADPALVPRADRSGSTASRRSAARSRPRARLAAHVTARASRPMPTPRERRCAAIAREARRGGMAGARDRHRGFARSRTSSSTLLEEERA